MVESVKAGNQDNRNRGPNTDEVVAKASPRSSRFNGNQRFTVWRFADKLRECSEKQCVERAIWLRRRAKLTINSALGLRGRRQQRSAKHVRLSTTSRLEAEFND